MPIVEPSPNFSTTPPEGLSSASAHKRLAREGHNILPNSLPKSNWAIVIDVLTEPMFLMLLVAGGIYLALGDPAEALFLLVFVVVVIVITLLQERRTQRTLEALRDLSAPRALVIRDGQEVQIPAAELVKGDRIIVREGDRIAADAVLIAGDISVDESLLTGEAVAVNKIPLPTQTAIPTTDPGGENTPLLFASTVVTRGVGQAEIIATASATAVGRIGKALLKTIEPTSALQQGSRRLVRNLAMGAILLALSLVLLDYYWNEQPLLQSLLAGIALAMAILPEEIPVILTVFLAMGAWQIAQKKVLTRRVSAVESLGAITVLAVDKTGTLTLNCMAIAELATPNLSGTGELFITQNATNLPETFHQLAEFAILATPSNPFDPMEKAIIRFGEQWLTGTEHLHRGREPSYEYALSSNMLAMTKVFSGADNSSYLLATKGAPEALADLCHLTMAERDIIALQVSAMAERGLRVLGVASGHWISANNEPTQQAIWPPTQHDFDFTFLGLVALADPPRPEVSTSLQECRRAGIRVIMMTGDHPATALAIARQIGLSDRPEVITGAEIASLNDENLKRRLQHIDLCARLQPIHKLRLVEILQQMGEIVAMTGDGVNDAPALKAANIGIAMGEHGTDVAREAAALVLLDDSFSHIVAAIRQGRRIYDNICKATRFAFAVHIPIIALALAPALLHWPILLLPIHIVLLELLIDPACSIIFQAEPESSDVMTRPPRPATQTPFGRDAFVLSILQGGGLAMLLLSTDAILSQMLWEPAQIRSVVFIGLLLGLFALILANRDLALGIFSIRKNGQRNPWLLPMSLAIVTLIGIILYTPLNKLAGIAPLSSWGFIFILGIILASYIWMELVRKLWKMVH